MSQGGRPCGQSPGSVSGESGGQTRGPFICGQAVVAGAAGTECGRRDVGAGGGSCVRGEAREQRRGESLGDSGFCDTLGARLEAQWV